MKKKKRAVSKAKKTVRKKTLNKALSKLKNSKKIKKNEINEKKDKNLLIESKTAVKKIERVSSGVSNFDKLTHGGFEKNSTNLIVGGAGSGKTIFGVQFLIQGLKKNEPCLYITFEESKNEFYSNMLELGWNLENLEKKGKFFFVEYTPEKVKTMLEEGGGIIESLILREKITRIVIDSITSFGLLFEDDLEKRGAALSLFNMLRKWDCTTILTYEGEPSRDKKVDSRVLEFESDSIILLYFLRNNKQRERYLEILKMRGTAHSTKIYNYSIKKNGIILSKKPFSGKLQ